MTASPHCGSSRWPHEACPAELAQKWASGRRFYNVYGLTETAVWSVSTLLKPDCKRPPIGWPIRNTQVYVLDEDLQPVPVGVQGEVYLGGRAIGRGYVNRPGLTAAAFVPDPYGAPGGRIVPHRRHRRPAARRCRGGPRPPRQPGEAARIPHRAG